MALKKKITSSNGIVTEYHRIAMLKIDTNQQNTILVHSYLSVDGRQIEKDYASGLYDVVEPGLMNFPYVDAQYLDLAYDGEMDIKKAYEWLKLQPMFAGSEDV